MIVLASKITGSVDEFASRIPSAVAATLLLLIAYALGKMLADPWAGFLSGLILATNYQFLGNARESVMDMTFAFFIGLTIFLSYIAIRKEKMWLLILSFIPASLAILTKGPAGLAIPACVTFLYLLMLGRVRRSTVPLLAGGLLSALLALVWFLLAGREYFDEFILHQNLTRYLNAFDHHENLFYYFHKLFFNFLPWSMLLPFSLYHDFKRKYWLPLIWFLFTFLFFEMSTSKRAIYLLSLYPAAALLCGLHIRDKWSWLVEESKTNMCLKMFAFLLVSLPLGAIAALFAVQNEIIAEFRTNQLVYVYLVVIFIAGAIFLYTLMRKFEKTPLLFLFVYLVLVGFFYNSCYLPVIDKAFKSPRLITDSMKGFINDKDVFLYRDNSAGLMFYIGKPTKVLSNAEDIRRYAKVGSVLIINENDARNVASDLNGFYRPIKKANYEKEAYISYMGMPRP